MSGRGNKNQRGKSSNRSRGGGRGSTNPRNPNFIPLIIRFTADDGSSSSSDSSDSDESFIILNNRKTSPKKVSPKNLRKPREAAPPRENVNNRNNKKRKLDDEKEHRRSPPKKVRYEGEIKTLSDLITLSDSTEDYVNISMRNLRKIKDNLIELNSLVGLKKLKQTVLQQILYFLQGLHTGDDYMHTVIYGSPGTGKTTVAKILGKIFSNLGILRKNKFSTAKRDDLVAGYLGQTAIKTSMVMEAANHGVLFIDEIYSLGEKENRDSFSKEAIDTINLYLSENKKTFMMIVAGYEKEVEECFFSFNPGLRRRFMWYHTIDPYNSEDLTEIFKKKISDIKWFISSTVKDEEVKSFFEKHKDKFKYGGGDIENFVTLCKVEHSFRIFGKDENTKKFITMDDMNTSIKKFKHDEKKPDTPPPMMYT